MPVLEIHPAISTRIINTLDVYQDVCVWSTLLYCCETWTLKKAITTKLEAFEMWQYRRMLKIPWTAMISNVEVLTRMKIKRQMIQTIKNRKIKYFGHMIRHQESQRRILEGKIEGKRSRGRRRTTCMDNITEWTAMSYAECVRGTNDRKRWRSIAANLLREDGTRQREHYNINSL